MTLFKYCKRGAKEERTFVELRITFIEEVINFQDTVPLPPTKPVCATSYECKIDVSDFVILWPSF
jgi:hypothetical protein